jgi:hypothetical protein
MEKREALVVTGPCRGIYELRKVGGYIFIHQLLLEYFASLNTMPTLHPPVAQKQQK